VFPQIKGTTYFSKEAAELVFADAQQNLEQIYAMLEKDESPKGFDLPFEIELESTSSHKYISSPNVAAILEGSDPSLKNEYVVYSAHSDHYSFVKQGIPSVFLVPGFKSADPEIDGSKKFSDFHKSNYHKPGDDFSQAFNWQAATKFAEVNYHIGLTLANQAQRSSWNEGDLFGDNFSK